MLLVYVVLSSLAHTPHALSHSPAVTPHSKALLFVFFYSVRKKCISHISFDKA
jgi:hypothetical protein